MNNRAREIVSGGLHIVPETLQDAENIYEYIGCDLEIPRYTGWNPYHTLQETIEKIKKDLSADDSSYSWVIRKDGAFVGTIGAYSYDEKDLSIEIGYSIVRHHWGNGYARTAVKAVVAFLQSEPDIETIRAWSHKDNIASRKVLLHAGLQETGTDGDRIIFALSGT